MRKVLLAAILVSAFVNARMEGKIALGGGGSELEIMRERERDTLSSVAKQFFDLPSH